MGRPPRISQDAIVGAALDLGLDAVSMQGIADRLGVTTPALYSHVAGRDEVVELAGAALRDRLGSFTSTAEGWRDWLADFAGQVRRHLAGSAGTLLGDPRVGVGEEGLRLLIAEGLSPTEAAYAVWLVFRTALAADASLAGFVDETGAVLGPEPGPGLRATRAVHDALVAEGPHDTFAFDLGVVLDGIAARIAARP